MKGRYQWCLILALVTCRLTAQVNAQPPEGLSKGNLQEQFDYMVGKSSRYQHYKVVPQTWLNTFWNHVHDTLETHQGLLKANMLTIDAQKKEIEQDQAELGQKQAEIAALTKEKNNLVFLGISMHKATYHVLVWAIIGALAFGLIFFLGRFRFANAITRRTRTENRELQEKVEQLRKRMLEKEQELRRQLQDEINKRLGD